MVAKHRSTRMAAALVLPLLGLVLGIALALGGGSHAAAQTSGAMAVDCEGNTLEVDDNCSFGGGQEFAVSAQIVSTPPDGYTFFQVKLEWDSSVLRFVPAPSAAAEVVWPHCDVPARSETETTLLFACVPFPSTPNGLDLFQDTGPVLLFTFACTGDGTSDVTLVPREGDENFGSHFGDASIGEVDPSLEAASITCGGADVQRPDAEVSTNPPPTISADSQIPTPDPDAPTPDATEETEATAPGPTAEGTDASEATATGGTPAADADDDDDDDGVPVWVWIIIGLAVVAGAGALGYVGWRRLRTEQAPPTEESPPTEEAPTPEE